MLEAWSNFFVAVAGAAAALAGLLFVAISINLSRILEFPQLPSRGFEALEVLIMSLLVSLFGLVPGQSPRALGMELALTGFSTWLVLTSTLVKHRKAHYGSGPARVIMNQLPPLPLLVAGYRLAHHDAAGAYWIVPAVVLSFIAAILSAWILLVEIQR